MVIVLPERVTTTAFLFPAAAVKLTVAEPTRFGFDEAGAAYAALEGRRTTGKVLLVP